MKRRLIGMAVLTAMILGCMTGCGESSESSSVAETSNSVTEPNNSVVTTDTTFENSTEAVTDIDNSISKNEGTSVSYQPSVPEDEEREYYLVPNISETHSSETSLNIVNICGQEIDITNLNAEDFKSTLEEASDVGEAQFSSMKTLVFSEESADRTKTTDFYFKGYSFAVKKSNGLEPLLYAEMVMGNTFVNRGAQRANLPDYEVKAIAVTRDTIDEREEDFTFCGGVQIGMLEEDVVAALGEGVASDAFENHAVYYKTPSATLLVVYKEFSPLVVENGKETANAAETIVLFKNDQQ